MGFSTVQRPLELDNPLIDALSRQPVVKSATFTRLLNIMGLKNSESVWKEFPDCRYLNYKSRGVSFCFDKLGDEFKLAAIHIYNPQPKPDISADSNSNKNKKKQIEQFSRMENMQNILPYRIDQHLKISDIVHKFAPVEPEKGGGGRNGGVNIWTRYPDYGIMFEYPTNSWEDDITWSECTLYTVAS